MESIGRCECNAKGGTLVPFIGRGHLRIDPHSRKLWYVMFFDLFYESASLIAHLLGQIPSYNVWQRIETLRCRPTVTEYLNATLNRSEKGEGNVNPKLVHILRRIHKGPFRR